MKKVYATPVILVFQTIPGSMLCASDYVGNNNEDFNEEEFVM